MPEMSLADEIGSLLNSTAVSPEAPPEAEPRVSIADEIGEMLNQTAPVIPIVRGAKIATQEAYRTMHEQALVEDVPEAVRNAMYQSFAKRKHGVLNFGTFVSPDMWEQITSQAREDAAKYRPIYKAAKDVMQGKSKDFDPAQFVGNFSSVPAKVRENYWGQFVQSAPLEEQPKEYQEAYAEVQDKFREYQWHFANDELKRGLAGKAGETIIRWSARRQANISDFFSEFIMESMEFQDVKKAENRRQELQRVIRDINWAKDPIEGKNRFERTLLDTTAMLPDIVMSIGSGVAAPIYWMMTIAPEELRALRARGVEDSVAKPIALFSGLAQGVIETVQIKGFGSALMEGTKAAGKKAFLMALAKTSLHEFNEEAAQAAVQLAAKAMAVYLSENAKGMTSEEIMRDLDDIRQQLERAALSLPLLVGVSGSLGRISQLPGEISAGREFRAELRNTWTSPVGQWTVFSNVSPDMVRDIADLPLKNEQVSRKDFAKVMKKWDITAPSLTATERMDVKNAADEFLKAQTPAEAPTEPMMTEEAEIPPEAPVTPPTEAAQVPETPPAQAVETEAPAVTPVEEAPLPETRAEAEAAPPVPEERIRVRDAEQVRESPPAETEAQPQAPEERIPAEQPALKAEKPAVEQPKPKLEEFRGEKPRARELTAAEKAVEEQIGQLESLLGKEIPSQQKKDLRGNPRLLEKSIERAKALKPAAVSNIRSMDIGELRAEAIKRGLPEKQVMSMAEGNLADLLEGKAVEEKPAGPAKEIDWEKETKIRKLLADMPIKITGIDETQAKDLALKKAMEKFDASLPEASQKAFLRKTLNWTAQDLAKHMKVEQEAAYKKLEAEAPQILADIKKMAKKGGKRGEWLADRYKKARENIAERKKKGGAYLGALGGGLQPLVENIVDYAVIGAYHIQQGLRSFKAWSQQMITDIGASIEPHLKELWKTSKQIYIDSRKTEAAEATIKERIQEAVKPSADKITVGLDDLLANALKREERGAAKGYRAGQEDLVRKHKDLIKEATEYLGKEPEALAKLGQKIARVRTPAEIAKVREYLDKTIKKVRRANLLRRLDKAMRGMSRKPRTKLTTKDFRNTLAAEFAAYVKEHSDVEIPEHIKEAIESIPETPETEWETDTIASVLDIADMLLGERKTANAAKNAARKERYARNSADVKREIGEPKIVDGEVITADPNILKRTWQHIAKNIETITEQIGDKMHDIVYGGVNKSHSEQIRLKQKYKDAFQKRLEKHGVALGDKLNAWSSLLPGRTTTVPVKLPSGVEIRWTPARRAAFELTARNARAYELLKLPRGLWTWVLEGGKETPLKLAKPLTDADIETIRESLTDEELRLADAVHDFLVNDLALEVNEVSLALYDFMIANDPDYCPVYRKSLERQRHAEAFNVVNSITGQPTDSLRSVESWSALKIRKDSDAPLIIPDIFAIVSEHIAHTSALKAYAENMREVNALFADRDFRTNYVHRFGERAYHMLRRMIRRVEHRASHGDVLSKFWNNARNKISSSILPFSPSTLVAQTLSLPTAANEISVKYIGQYLTPRPLLPSEQKIADTVASLQYAPPLWVRRRGYISRDAGDLMQMYEMQETITGKNSAYNQILRTPMSKFDQWAIDRIILACYAEAKASGLEGEALLRKTGERAEEVTRRTQPTWDAKDRTSLGGTESDLWKSLTMFRSFQDKLLIQADRHAWLWAKRGKTPSATLKFAAVLINLSLIPALLNYSRKRAWRTLRGKKEREGVIGRSLIMEIISIFPFGGNIASALVSGLEGSPFVSDPMATPISDTAKLFVTTATNTAKQIYELGVKGKYFNQKQVERLYKNIRGLITLAGRTTGLPLEGVMGAGEVLREQGKKLIPD